MLTRRLSFGGCVLLILSIILFTQALLSVSVLSCKAWAGKDKLVEMVDGVAQEMQLRIGSGSVYFDVKEFQNTVTHEVPILSIQLYHHLQAALARVGFSLAENTAVADYLIQCQFQNNDGKVDFFFKYYKIETPDRFKIINATIKARHLPDDAFEENLETKALMITSKLLDNPAAYRRLVSGHNRLKVFVNPIVESRYKYQSDFSENFLSRIRSQLIKSDFLEIVEPRPIKFRGLSRVKRQSAQIKDLEGSDAVLADADAVMDGTYSVTQNFVSVNLRIRSADGTLLGSVEEELPKEMITFELENLVAKQAATVADVASRENMDSHVKITTDKGGAYQTYIEDEVITFIIQVAKPLYLYVYNIDTHNKVNRLYPEDDTNKAITPGELYTFPPLDADWEIAVTPPFGLDNVVVFACEQALPLPRISDEISSVSFDGEVRGMVRRDKKMALARQGEINPLDLVEYFRGAALLQGAKLYEDNIMITTKAK